MGESACLRRSFSHPSDASREFTQGDPIRALTESVSFGRFMSESLAWEKFSTFSHNRYLEEVEKFSKPGAVAEKKAYFEAHFKRRAAMRAAAVAEETSMASTDAFETETTQAVRNDCSSIDENQVASSYDANECNPNVETNNLIVLEEQALIEENHNDETSTLVENANIASEKMESSDNSASSSKKIRTSSSSKSSSNSKASKLPLCPSKPSTPVQVRNSVDISSKVSRSSNEKKRRIPSSVHVSMNFAPSDGGTSGSVKMPKDSSPRQNTPMRILKKAAAQFNLVLSSHKRQSNSALKSSTPRDQSTPRQQATTRIGNDDDAIYSKKPAGNPSEKKKSISKSLHMSINFASGANETSTTSLRMPRDLSTRVTPTLVPVDVESKHPPKVLHPEDKSSSKPSNPSRSKVQPFSFRSDERATKRKEFFQKIEEKSKELDKEQMQTRPKVKAENRFNMLRQSTGMKAKPPEDLSHESQRPNNLIKKIPLTKPRSPKLGRKPSSNSTQDASSRPPQTHSINTGNPKRVAPKNNRTSMKVTSVTKNRHENASPNIQH